MPSLRLVQMTVYSSIVPLKSTEPTEDQSFSSFTSAFKMSSLEMNSTRTGRINLQSFEKIILLRFTGGDNSNKACFRRRREFFREFGDFIGNRETEIFLGNIIYFRDMTKKSGHLAQY